MVYPAGAAGSKIAIGQSTFVLDWQLDGQDTTRILSIFI
jgi:hypothetical protein